jgi:hypothetical protein
MESTQLEEFRSILSKSKLFADVFDRTAGLKLPNWYIAAGILSQTVWNHLHGFESDANIKDIDLVYFDPDTSYEAEDKYIQRGKDLFEDLQVDVEIRNQARVYLWYEDHFGISIPPYHSVEDAISSWPTTITCIGITKDCFNIEKVYSTFGLNDLLNMIVRPNKRMVTKQMYESKAERWQSTWPKLKILPW